MNINEYFDAVQEYVKTKLKNPEEIDNIIKQLNNNNIQAIINQDFNNNVTIEESGEKILKSKLRNFSFDNIEQNTVNSSGLNKQEKRIFSFKEFLNEKGATL